MNSVKWFSLLIAVAGLLTWGFFAVTSPMKEYSDGSDAADMDEVLSQKDSPKAKALREAMSRAMGDSDGVKRKMAHDHHDEQFTDESEAPIFGEGPVGQRLTKLYSSIDSGDPDADAKVEELLAELRLNAPEAVAELSAAYGNLKTSQFVSRYKLAYLAEQLQVKEAYPFLEDIAVGPVPKGLPAFGGDGTTDHYGNEIMVKMRALGGLSKLAEEGHQGARESIHQLALQNEDLTLKKDAIHAFLKTSSDLEGDQKLLKSELPESEHALLTLEEDKVEDLPQLPD